MKILVIGDSCIDQYHYGTCKRVNPEAPVPILDYKTTVIKEGMCRNVAANLSMFGVDVMVITHQETIVKTRFIDERSNQHILRVDQEFEINPYVVHPDDLKGHDAIVISDYDKGFITRKIMDEIISLVDCPVFIDSKNKDLPLHNCIVKVNEYEYYKLNRTPDICIVTKGSQGATLDNHTYPVEDVEVLDVVGAGDTFLAGLVFGYLKYSNLAEAILLANKASTIAVQHRGTYVLTKKDVEAIV